MPSINVRLRPTCLLILLLALAALGIGCNRAPAPLPGAESEPAAAVQHLAALLRRNDLVGYARAMVTPAQYGQLEVAWRDGRSRWPLTELPLADELPAMLAALTRADADKRLQQSFDAQVAGQASGIRSAARSLGMFGVQYLRNQSHYSPEQRAHYVQLVDALSAWAADAPLADRERGHAAIAKLVAAARASGLHDAASLRAAGMEDSLRRLGPLFAALKEVAGDYGLSLDATLDDLRAGLVSQQGGVARVRIQYPLAAAQIDTSASLVQREGHWYLQDTLQEVDALLATPPPAPSEPPVPTPQTAGLPAGR